LNATHSSFDSARAFAAVIALLVVLLAGCASGSGSINEGPQGDFEELERLAYDRTGDVRVFFYVKARQVVNRGLDGTARVVEQPELKHILVNRGHSFYQGVPDHRLSPAERFLFNADMHDLLIVLRDQFGYFRAGNSVNILSDDPIARADREPNVGRIIAIEQIVDGQVNTSYFARRLDEDRLDPARARVFNDCQAIVMEVISKAVPRGVAGQGEGDPGALGRR
jgi:hypothetical protein